MKIHLKNIVASLEALRELAQLKFKAKQAFVLAKLIKDCQSHLESYESIRISTVKKYSAEGNKVDEDKTEIFMKELNELLEKEVEVHDASLSQQELEECSLSASQILLLEWLITKE